MAKKLKKYQVEFCDEKGKKTKTIIIAPTKEYIEKDLSKNGFTVLSIKRQISFSARRDMSIVEAFFKNLANLLESGFSTSSALEILLEAESDPEFKRVIGDILETLAKGYGFVEGLRLHPEWFSLPLRMIVESGEKSGRFAETISECCVYIQEEKELSKSLWSEIAAPLLTFVFGVIIIIINSTVTIPKMCKSAFFKQVMAPHMGKSFALISATAKAVPVVAIALMLFAFAILYLYRVHQEMVESFLLKVPLIRKVWFDRDVFLTYFSLGKLTSVGVRLDTALEVVAENARLKQVKKGFEESLSKVKLGLSDWWETMPMLDAVERALLRGATTMQKVSAVFFQISKRKRDSYRSAVKKLPFLCKLFTMIALFYFLALIFFGVVLPYFKSISSLMSQIG